MENHDGCDTCARAWAAGLFDAEGSAPIHTPRGRLRAQPQLFVYQAGGSAAPPVLMRFRDIVECGTVVGPYRGRLWCWRAGSVRDIARVATSLWPWLGGPKRGQLLKVSQHVPALSFLPTIADVWDGTQVGCRDGLLDCSAVAWAGGLFVGEGWIGVARAAARPRSPQLRAEISQAGEGSGSSLLERFLSAVGGRGAIGGPYPPRGTWSKHPQFRWRIGSEEGTREVMNLLWPWLDDRKRAQVTQAFEAVDASRRSFTSRATKPVSG